MGLLDSGASFLGGALDPGAAVHSLLNQVLPKDLQFLGGVAGAIVDYESGNPLGALKQGLSALSDLNDLSQRQSQGGPGAPGAPGYGWSYEPSPPPRGTAPSPAMHTLPGGGWRGAPAWNADPSHLSQGQFMNLGDKDFMNAIGSGKIPSSISDDPKSMLALQQRMNHITEMNQLMTNMLKAVHDMRMSVIQNLRV